MSYPFNLLLFLSISLFPLFSNAQIKLKEVTEYYPKTKTIKNRYFVIKPEKEVYHGPYEVYLKNGRFQERGYFDHGVKTSFIAFNTKGQVIKELSDSVFTTNTYFSNGELKSVEIKKNSEPFGTWKNYALNECGKPFLVSSTTYRNRRISSKTESIHEMFLGVCSVNTLVTQDAFGNMDTTHVHTNCDVIYPSEARRNQIEGTLFIQLSLTNDCDFNYELINELGYGIEDQFINKLELAKKNLQTNQNCQVFEATFPVKFELR
ncbi:MAG: hypothetical protein AAF551_13615 [Bacteroidota bacterium]